MAEEFESYNSVTLTDENGRDIEFELVDAIEHGGRKYCVLFPAEMPCAIAVRSLLLPTMTVTGRFGSHFANSLFQL